MCPATRVPAQRQGYSGKGGSSLGVDNTGDPNRGERHEARAAEGLLTLVGTWDREEQAHGQGLISLLLTTWWLQPLDRSGDDCPGRWSLAKHCKILLITGETEAAGDINNEPRLPASYS